MFAIVLNEANLPKILQTDRLTIAEAQALADAFAARKSYVFVRGYLTQRNTHNTVQDWAIMPMFVFQENYNFDPDRIRNDWVLTVHV